MSGTSCLACVSMHCKLSIAVMAETGGGDSAGELPKEGDAAAVHGWRGELKQLMLVAGPMIFVNLFVMAIQLISVMFVGHLGELALSRSTIATSFSNVVGISVVTGMSTALDTLCGQAYGAKKYRLVGLYLQQSLIVLNLSSIPFVFIFAYVGDILQWLRQDPEIAIGAGEYARCLIPALFGLATSQSHTRFLLAQSLVVPTFFCAFATLACHIPLCWVLVYRSSLGFQGAAVATSISNWINALLLTSYVRFSKACQKTRTSLTWEAFHDLKYFLQLAIPSAGMICLEWWCYELLVLVAGLLPNPVLQASTLSICMNTAAMHFQIPFGIGAGVSTRVSNELGAGRSQTARTAVKVALCVALSEAIIMSIILISTHNLVGRIYSNDQDVISYVSMIVPMLSVSVFFDSTQATLSGAARGCGFQKFGACINLGAYYFVGLPIGCVLAFRTSLEGQGLWVTALCASFVQSTCFAILVSTINWDKQVLKAAARLDASGEPLLA